MLITSAAMEDGCINTIATDTEAGYRCASSIVKLDEIKNSHWTWTNLSAHLYP